MPSARALAGTRSSPTTHPDPGEPKVTISPSPLADFGIGVSFDGVESIVAVIGEVDILTAPELDAVVNAVIDGDHRRVVLDLSRCTFLDASGLGVMVAAVLRLRRMPLSGVLTLRSPSAMTLRTLATTGLDQIVAIEQDVSPATHLGREQAARGMVTGVRISADTVAESLGHVTAIPAARDLVDGALRLVVALAKATVQGADGVSVSLSRHGRLSTVAASDQTILDMDADQYATGEGPCVDASIEGRWFHSQALDSETRWPAFVPKAQTLGIKAILSNPLLVGERSVGALNIYSNTPGAFHPKDQRLASVFATEASTILADAGAAVPDAQLASRLVEALHSRELISRAQGIVMQRDGVSAEAAYASLRESSRRSNRPIRELAAELGSATVGPDSSGFEAMGIHVG